MAPKKRGGRTSASRSPAPSPIEQATPFTQARGTAVFGQRPSPAVSSSPHTPDGSDNEDSIVRRAPVAFSPVKARQRKKTENLRNLSDADAWKFSDDEIIDAAFSGLKSTAYQHYNISLDRASDGTVLTFVFTCKVDPTHHSPHYRPRMKTSSGTGNLVAGINACNQRRGISTSSSTSGSHVPYTQANHRALLAMRCATNMRPFNFVQDPMYRAEVDMLRPGTSIPDPTTVSRDVKLLYEKMSIHVGKYFKELGAPIHLVVDGWTAPITASFLGVVVVWCEKGVSHRIILEFIRLKQRHTGQYLAEEIAGCLKRYGISHLLFSLTMDNTSNCNKTAEILPSLIPSFLGEAARVRCFNHILHLTAEMFMSFFFKKRKSKKKLTQKGKDDVLEDVDADEDEDAEEDAVNLEEIEVDDAELADDDGQTLYRKAAVYSVREQAVKEMEERGVFLAPGEVAEALAVSGLARRVHDSGELSERFDKLVDSDPLLDGAKRTLDRRVPTRWNSDKDCLGAHQYFRRQVEQLTGLSETKLRPYRLTESQWKIADDLVEALAIFDEPSRLFSAADVPLIVDVIPAFDDLRLSLEGIRDDDDNENDISPVMRVAAQAAIFMIDKYETLSWDCPIYYIAIVMCPDRKLQWFRNREYDRSTLKYIKDLVVDYFMKYYHVPGDSSTASGSSQPKKSRFIRKVDDPVGSSAASYAQDHIQTYLKDPPVATSTITDAGGYLKYWESARVSRPCLARMGSTFCSTPASSVEAERAFSIGRRHVNFMQHNTTPNTFKSKMGLGSWSKAPFFPPISKLGAIIAAHSSGEVIDGLSSDSDSN
ncbi:hypothetical protein D9611_000913 [Ephemerocybe angulata]|uniref:HAT C-terminal dimerisation domain-containing protein n=1 Tax=Ephemerocybe angulata TaxID=980116 RepID=A0A8H5BM76_9AGAR|nr:hypothetical protein D9611_000913 [Tulosesus angulatus]